MYRDSLLKVYNISLVATELDDSISSFIEAYNLVNQTVIDVKDEYALYDNVLNTTSSNQIQQIIFDQIDNLLDSLGDCFESFGSAMTRIISYYNILI